MSPGIRPSKSPVPLLMAKLIGVVGLLAALRLAVVGGSRVEGDGGGGCASAEASSPLRRLGSSLRRSGVPSLRARAEVLGFCS